ncbi:hypothetical protein E0663_17255 [Salmonella enterica subsp. enterica]|nr:hypothetical protein [Salmonella enterica subsp. enterica]
MNFKINGNERRFLNTTLPKADILFKCINLMVKHNISQARLAQLSGIPYESVRKMFRTMSSGSWASYGHLYDTLLNLEVTESNKELGYIPQEKI